MVALLLPSVFSLVLLLHSSQPLQLLPLALLLPAAASLSLLLLLPPSLLHFNSSNLQFLLTIELFPKQNCSSIQNYSIHR